jgi:hypothetical protein
MLLTNPERLKAMVANAESLGVPRGSGMFRLLLRGGGLLSSQNGEFEEHLQVVGC